MEIKATDCRREFIRQVTDTYIEEFREEAEELARFFKEMASMENRGGRWAGGNGYVEIRFPGKLFYWLRFAFTRAGIFPVFGDDSSDLEILRAEYPDLFRTRKKRSWAQGPVISSK